MTQTCINTAGVQYVLDHLAKVPRPDLEATRAIRLWAAQNNLQLDPDQLDVVTLHYCGDGSRGNQAVITSRMSLTQALVSNWQGESNNNYIGALFPGHWAGNLPLGPMRIVERLPPQDLLSNGAAYLVFNGVFRRSDPARYDHSTLVQLPAEQFQRFIETLDFHSSFKTLLDLYWQDNLENHRLSAKVNFIAACNKQVDEGSLSDEARKLAWRAADVLPRVGKLRLSTLNIYGYAATDLLYINDAATDLTLLYLPGNSSPIHEFASEALLKDWVGQQCQDAAKRQALKQHFNLADGPDGLEFSGLDTALAGLGEFPNIHHLPANRPGFTNDGRWSPRDYVNYRPRKYNARLSGDLFQALAERQQQRSYADADFIITSNSEVNKAKWRGYLNCALNLLTPLTFVVPGLAPLLAVGGIAQLGLGLDQAINGKTLQDKADGVSNITWGLFNALPLAVEGLVKGKELFQFNRDGFFFPSRINDQVGYPLSPINPPHLPELDIAPFFSDPDVVAPLENGNAAVSRTVRRLPGSSEQPLDRLLGNFDMGDGYFLQIDLMYDMEFDLFRAKDSLNDVTPRFYKADPQTGLLVITTPNAQAVTNEMRAATLRSLGVDLPIPVELPVPVRGAQPIPKQISSLWVGDKVIDPHLLDNLADNVKHLKNSDFQYRLFLTKAHPSVYEENLSLLKAKVPGLQVLPLEDQAFFTQFEHSKYAEQYRDALDGNGGVARNYSSASDVLRYPMLNSEGGLYMDVDDQLLEPGRSLFSCIEVPCSQASESISNVELATTEDGLLLYPPLSNKKLGMHLEYNTSIIGSHANNPTLTAISEEMYERYLGDPDFYQTRPDKDENPTAFRKYCLQLNYLTGPRLLTDMVDRLFPDLYRLRQLHKLYAMPRAASWLYVDTEYWKIVEERLLPLDRFAKVGNNESWATT